MEGKVLYITNIDRRFSMMRKACDILHEDNLIPSDYEVLKIDAMTAFTDVWERKLVHSDLVIIRFMGNTIRTLFWDKCLHFLRTQKIPFYMDASGSAEGEFGDGISDDVADLIKKYSTYGGIENYKNLWYYLASLFNPEIQNVPLPESYCWAGIFHPDLPKTYTTDVKNYINKYIDPQKPTIGFVFYRDEWIWGDLAYQTAFIREAEKQGVNVISVFTNGMPDPSAGMPSIKEVFQKYFTCDGNTIIDAMVNVMKFSFTTSGSISVEDLKVLGVPILQAYSLIMPKKEWEESSEGMNPMEISISISIPEFDGIIHGLPIAYKHFTKNDEVEYLPMEERMSRMVSKAKKWAMLHRKANKDKKIAIIFHNYPPTNSSIGSALGLDSIESIRKLLERMKQEEYAVDFIPENTESFMDILTSHATNDMTMMTEKRLEMCQKVSKETYKNFYQTFENSVKKQMEKDWGEAPGKIMFHNDGLLVPGTMNGNVFITVQAPRGYGMDPDKVYHDPLVAPTHQYIAFYEWIRDVWKADAVIHVGTHGNLEWLPGKGAGLDRASYPDLALGDLPDLYIYHMMITGEGIQAKRRGAACLIDHLPAPLAEAGTYDELTELDKTLEEYAHFMQTEPENVTALEPLIRELAVKANLDGEVPLHDGEDFSHYAEELHEYVEELKNSEVHIGLHILGKEPEGEILIEDIIQLLRLPNGDIPSVYALWAEKYQVEYDALIESPGEFYEPLQITYSRLFEKIKEEIKVMVSFLVAHGFTKEIQKEALALPYISIGDEEWKEHVHMMISYICDTLIPLLSKTHEELDHLMDGLAGKYVLPGPSGSPHTGGVSLLPSGRNFFGIDPRILPTKAAWSLGQKLGNQMIEEYVAVEGKYPENVGIVFWAGSNMRSRGQCIAEYLYLLGVKPIWEKGNLYVKRLEVIPLEELKRPRIDVMGRISGLFRDTMPQVVKLVDKAVLMVADLDEPKELNYVKKHVIDDSQEMMASGVSKEEAWRRAAYRIFGDAPGTYGAGVSKVLDAKNWQTIDDLADVYVRWGGHAYGGDAHGTYSPELFRKRLSVTDVTIKNENNHETNVLSSDDYNAYHGGMIAAVKSISGKAPRSYVGDTTDQSKPRTTSLQAEVKRIFRTESINPKYIEGLMKHGYKGASDLAKMLSVSYQWDATSDVMDDWMYDKYAEKYAFDKDVQNWMRQVNPWALQNMAETLLEAQKRGMWNTSEEMVKKLQALYLSVEGDLEETGDDDG